MISGLLISLILLTSCSSQEKINKRSNSIESDTQKSQEASGQTPPQENKKPEPEQQINEPNAENGIKLYAKFCESCHMKIDSSTKKGATIDQIKKGLMLPQMSSIDLIESEILDISTALKETSNQTPPQENEKPEPEHQINEPNADNGVQLYAQFCESCHMKIDSSTKKGATIDRIKKGLTLPQMSSIELMDSEILDISTALNMKSIQKPEEMYPVKKVSARSNYQQWGNYNKNQIKRWIEEDRKKSSATTRYIYLDEDIFKHKTNRNMARVCMSKAINSVSITNSSLIHPRDVSNNHGVVFAIDLNDYFKDLAGIRNNRGTGNFRKPHVPENYLPEPIWRKLIAKSSNIDLAVSLFVYNMFRPDSYKYLIDHPLSDSRTNFSLLGISNKQPKIRMAIEDAIIFGIRYLEAYEYQVKLKNGKTLTRQYWRSGDPVYGVDGSNPKGLARFNNQCGARDKPAFDNSIVRTLTWDDKGGSKPRLNGGKLPAFLDNCTGGNNATGSESWRTLPNGLIAYYLWGVANSIELGGATSLIYNPIHRENNIMNLPLGECFYCHNTGAMYRTSDMATAKAAGKLTNKEAFDFWSNQSEIDKIYRESSNLYDNAIIEIVSEMSDNLELNKKLAAYTTVEPCYITSGYKFGTLANGEPDNTPADKK